MIGTLQKQKRTENEGGWRTRRTEQFTDPSRVQYHSLDQGNSVFFG